MKATIGWSVLVLFCGSSLLLAVAFAWDEMQWRLLEHRAGR